MSGAEVRQRAEIFFLGTIMSAPFITFGAIRYLPKRCALPLAALLIGSGEVASFTYDDLARKKLRAEARSK